MTGRYKAYPEYKDSGIEWLKEMPAHWDLIKAKHIFKKVQRAVRPEDGIVTAFRDGEVTLRSNRRTDGFTNAAKEIGYQGVRRGDLLVHAMDGFAGAIGISDSNGKCSPVCSVCIPWHQNLVNSNYYGYLVRQLAVTDYITSLAKGIRERSTEFRFNEFSGLFLAVPSKVEQQKIANFLDHETAKIDTLITKQEKLIELLKEKRQAVISHAVTKGLNPQAPMKDSGVEWLGEVPEHWEVSNLKYYASIQGGYAFNSNEFVDSGVQILRIGNVYQNKLALNRQPTFVSDTIFEQLLDFKVIRNDILMSLTGTLGKRDYGFAVKVDVDGNFLLNQRVAKLTPVNQKITRSYLLNVLWSESYLTQLYALPSGTKQANLSNSDVLGITVAIPTSKEEQTYIAEYIKEKVLKLDELTAKSKDAIFLMKERKTALISAAVTGKIDVRGWDKQRGQG